MLSAKVAIKAKIEKIIRREFSVEIRKKEEEILLINQVCCLHDVLLHWLMIICHQTETWVGNFICAGYIITWMCFHLSRLRMWNECSTVVGSENGVLQQNAVTFVNSYSKHLHSMTVQAVIFKLTVFISWYNINNLHRAQVDEYDQL